MELHAQGGGGTAAAGIGEGLDAAADAIGKTDRGSTILSHCENYQLGFESQQ
jgi:hypothetical protein